MGWSCSANGLVAQSASFSAHSTQFYSPNFSVFKITKILVRAYLHCRMLAVQFMRLGIGLRAVTLMGMRGYYCYWFAICQREFGCSCPAGSSSSSESASTSISTGSSKPSTGKMYVVGPMST